MAAKRLRDTSDEDSDQTEEKRMRTGTSFASVIREAAMMKSLCFALEPLLRRVVKEEVERGLVNGTRLLQRCPQMQIQVAESSSLQLIFGKPLSLPIFTGSKIEDEENNLLQILLVDTRNGGSSLAPIPSPLKVEIVVVDGDFPSGDREDWTSAEFNRSIVKERAGKRPLLNGDVLITLRDGIASIGELMFTDNSSWIRSRNFRLGARVIPGSYEGPRIREAMTEPFVVKDHRGELYKKNYPPSLTDEVWRLERIGKEGAFHKKLAAENINTVQDFLKLWVVDPNNLRRILGLGMSDRMWEGTINHATTCTMGEKLYLYRGPYCTILLNPICKVLGVVLDGLTYSPQELNGRQRAYVEQFVLEAYRHWDRLEEADGLLNGNTLLQNDPVPQRLIEQSSVYPSNQEIIRSENQNVGLDEVGRFPNSPQVESYSWIQNPMYSTPTIQRSTVYNMSDLSSDTAMIPAQPWKPNSYMSQFGS